MLKYFLKRLGFQNRRNNRLKNVVPLYVSSYLSYIRYKFLILSSGLTTSKLLNEERRLLRGGFYGLAMLHIRLHVRPCQRLRPFPIGPLWPAQKGPRRSRTFSIYNSPNSRALVESGGRTERLLSMSRAILARTSSLI